MATGWLNVADGIINIYDTCIENSEIYACGGALIKYTGSEWTQLAPKLVNYEARTIKGHNGTIYAGTQGAVDGGCLLEFNGSNAWTLVAPMYSDYQQISSLLEFSVDGYLYGGVVGWSLTRSALLRWNESTSWVEAAPSIESGCWELIEFNSKIYAGTLTTGALLEYNGINAWVKKASILNGQVGIYGLCVFNGELYAGTYPNGRLFKYNGSNAWVQVAASYYTDTHYIYSLKVHDSELYGAVTATGAGGQGGGTLLKFTGSAWTKVANRKLGEVFNVGLEELGGELYGGMLFGHLFRYGILPVENAIFYGINC